VVLRHPHICPAELGVPSDEAVDPGGFRLDHKIDFPSSSWRIFVFHLSPMFFFQANTNDR